MLNMITCPSVQNLNIRIFNSMFTKKILFVILILSQAFILINKIESEKPETKEKISYKFL